MIDIHTHILPGVDDGSRDFDQSLIMAGEAYNAGFTEIITTSHYMTNVYEADKPTRVKLIEKYQRLLDKNSIEIKLHNGAEIYFSEDFPELVKSGLIPTLADSQYVLFELPLRSKIIYIDSCIFKLKQMGYIPIIAHPERYAVVQNDIHLAEEWAECGALLQANFGSVVGFYGRSAKSTLFKLLKQDMISFFGSDNPRTDQIYANMPKIIKKLKRKIGEEKFYILTEENPKKIIEHKSLI